MTAVCPWCGHDLGWHQPGGVRCRYPACTCLKGRVRPDDRLTDDEKAALAVVREHGPMNTNAVRNRLGWGRGPVAGRSRTARALALLWEHGRVKRQRGGVWSYVDVGQPGG